MPRRPLCKVIFLVALIALLPSQLFGASRAVACAVAGHVMDEQMVMAGMSAEEVASSSGQSAQGGVEMTDAPECEHEQTPEQCMIAAACVALVFSLPPVDHRVDVAYHRDAALPLTVLPPASVTHPPALRPPRA